MTFTDSTDESLGTKLGQWGLLLSALVVFWFVFPLRGMDVVYKAGWMVIHWNDPAQFPPRSDLCMQIKCLRTDTVKKYVGGRRGYTSEFNYAYCPEHAPLQWRTKSRFDHFVAFWYWIFAFILSAFLVLPVILAVRIGAWPVLVPLAAMGRVSWNALLPSLSTIFDLMENSATIWQERMDQSAGLGSLIALAAAWVMFMWW